MCPAHPVRDAVPEAQVCQSGATSLTLHAIIKGVAGHQGTPVEIRREDECLCFQPCHDRQSLRLLCRVIIFKGIGEVSVQVITVVVFPLKEKGFRRVYWGCVIGLAVHRPKA